MKIAAKKIESESARDKLFNFRPVFFAAIFLCAGVLFAYAVLCYGLSPSWGLCLLPIAFLSVYLHEKALRRRAGGAWLALSICFLFGAWTFSRETKEFCSATAYNKEAEVYGRVVDLVEYDGYCLLRLDDLIIDGNRENKQLNAYLPAAFCQNVHCSDKILLCGDVVTDVSTFNDYGFRATDIRTGRCYALYNVESLTVTGHTFDVFAAVRSRMKLVLYTGMDESSAAVTLAVLTGNTTGIDAGLLANVRAGGIAHVFAVSGLHIGSLFAFCILLLKKTRLKKLPKAVRFGLVAAVVLFYAGVCGFTASSVRAAVVCLTGYAAKLIGVKQDFLQSLGLSAIVLLLGSPTALFEVGFQLSFAACLGLGLLLSPVQNLLLCVYAHVRKFFGGKTETDENAPRSVAATLGRSVTSAIGTTLAAQIATMPILLQWFGFVSGWSLLLNVLFVPIISGIFALLLAVTALACLLPSVCQIVLYVPSVLWQALLLVFETFDFSNFAWTTSLSGGAVAAYYGCCLFATDKWNVSKRTKRTLTAVCFLAFVVAVYASSA